MRIGDPLWMIHPLRLPISLWVIMSQLSSGPLVSCPIRSSCYSSDSCFPRSLRTHSPCDSVYTRENSRLQSSEKSLVRCSPPSSISKRLRRRGRTRTGPPSKICPAAAAGCGRSRSWAHGRSQFRLDRCCHEREDWDMVIKM